MIRQVLSYWKQAWAQSKPIFIAEAFGTLCGIISSCIFALTVPNPNLLLVLGLYTVSSYALVWSSFKRQTAWMLLLMSFYSVMNTIGMMNLLIPYVETFYKHI